MSRRKPLLCLITNRQTIPPKAQTANGSTSLSDPLLALLDLCQRAAQAGIDIIQIREKDLSARDLSELTSNILTALSGSQTAVLVNDRVDIALTCQAQGVQLRSDSLPVAAARKLTGNELLIGVSTHSLAEAQTAAASGASFILFGPIFDTPSKSEFGPPQGLAKLKQVVEAVCCPVIALGGIDRNNIKATLETGAAGIAAIRLFAEADDLKELADALKQY